MVRTKSTLTKQGKIALEKKLKAQRRKEAKENENPPSNPVISTNSQKDSQNSGIDAKRSRSQSPGTSASPKKDYHEVAEIQQEGDKSVCLESHDMCASAKKDVHKVAESLEEGRVEKSCLQCGRSKVSAYCENCEIDLCVTCKDRHLRIPNCKTHSVVDATEKKPKAQVTNVFCKLHPDNNVKYSCVPCQSAICVECKIEHHDTHPTESVEQALKAMVAQAITLTEAVSKSRDDLKQQFCKSKDEKNQYSEMCEARKKDIEDHKLEIITKLIVKVERDYNQLIEEVKSEHAAKKKELDIFLRDLEIQMTEKDSLLSWTKRVIDLTEGPGPLCELQGGLLKRLERAAEKEFKECKKVDLSLPEFTPSVMSIKDNFVGRFKHERKKDVAAERYNKWTKKLEKKTLTRGTNFKIPGALSPVVQVEAPSVKQNPHSIWIEHSTPHQFPMHKNPTGLAKSTKEVKLILPKPTLPPTLVFETAVSTLSSTVTSNAPVINQSCTSLKRKRKLEEATDVPNEQPYVRNTEIVNRNKSKRVARQGTEQQVMVRIREKLSALVVKD